MMVLALLAGFVASVAMLIAFGVAYAAAVLLGHVPVPLLGTWLQALTNNPLIDTAGPNLYAATGIFFVGGLVWAMLYGMVVEPRIAGRGWQRGIKFALIPWLFSLVIFLPLVGGGFLGFGLGAGPLPVIGNLILHLIYGALLGLVFGSAESVFDRPLHQGGADDLLAGRLHEIGAARGIAAGLALGLVAGVIGAFLAPHISALNPMAMVVGVALTGAAFGGFVGSLSSA